MGSHGYDSHGQHGAPGGYYSQETKHIVEDTHGGGHKEIVEKKEQKSGKGGMLAAGAGGLAVGAIGGAMVGHAMGTLNCSLYSSSATIPKHALTPFQPTTPTKKATTAHTSSNRATASNRATTKNLPHPVLHR